MNFNANFGLCKFLWVENATKVITRVPTRISAKLKNTYIWYLGKFFSAIIKIFRRLVNSRAEYATDATDTPNFPNVIPPRECGDGFFLLSALPPHAFLNGRKRGEDGKIRKIQFCETVKKCKWLCFFPQMVQPTLVVQRTPPYKSDPNIYFWK